jgi:arylsulfatase A-like enzyme
MVNMTMRCRVLMCFPIVALLGCIGPRAHTDAQRLPNIVFMLVDDMGWTDAACLGSDFYETPHIDRLAAEGILFNNAYASAAVCSPTRASLLTGQYPARLHITDWIPGAKYPHARLKIPDQRTELPLAERTLAEALHERGYATWHVGKWHLGSAGHGPCAQGFDVNIGGGNKGQPASFHHPYESPPGANPDFTVPEMGQDGEAGEYLTDRLTAEAIALIESHTTSQRAPFFLYMSYYTLHAPYEAKAEVVEYYRRKKREGARHHHAVYAAMVHALDENVGRLLAALDRLGLADETVVIFTSDNGGVGRVSSNAPLRAGKGHLYEGGIRVPLLVRGPGVPAGRSTDALTITTDWYPTLTGLSGHSEESADGVDIRSVLLDPAARLGRDAIFWHYPHYHTSKRPPCAAIRNWDWKLIEWSEDGTVELYNLLKDIGETDNVTDLYPDVTAALLRRLHVWQNDVGAQHATPNPQYDADKPFRGGHVPWDLLQTKCSCAAARLVD